MLLDDSQYARCEKCNSINQIPGNNYIRNENDFLDENENNFNIQVPFMVINFILISFYKQKLKNNI